MSGSGNGGNAGACLACAGGLPHEPWTDEDAENVEAALRASDADSAGHWPTVAGWLACEVRRLRARVAELEAAESAKSDDAPTTETTKTWHEIRLRFTDNRGKSWDKRVRSDQDCGNDPERWRRRVEHGAALARDLRATDPDAYFATRTVSTTTRTTVWKAESP